MKRRTNKGGKTRYLGVGYGDIGEKEVSYVVDVLKKKRLSYGEYHRKFEESFAKVHDRKFAIFSNSGTSALQVGLHALKEKYGWRDNSEVLVPALTFVASVNVILQNRLKPVLVDVNPDYYDIDVTKIEEKITKNTVAIMPVHLFGQPADMDPIVALSKKHNLKIMEDSCETMFAKYKGKPVGSFGDVSCFSTYIAHLLVTGVGGFTTTNDSELAVLIKSLINHGRDGIYLSIDDDNTTNKKELFNIVEKRFSFIHIGYSYRATEMEAALGVAQMERWKEIIGGHKKAADYLTKGLADLQNYLTLPKVRKDSEHVFMMYPIVVRSGKTSRDDLIRFLEENMVETRYMLPLTNQPVYKNILGDIEDNYPVAKNINKNGFYIGSHQGFSTEDLDYIIEKFHQFFQRLNDPIKTSHKNAFLLYSSELASRIFTVVFTIFIARSLGSTDLGKLAFTISLIAIFSVISDFGLTQFLVREGSRIEESLAKTLHGSIISLRIIFSFILFIFLLVYSHFLIEDSETKLLVLLYSLTLIINVFPNLVISILRIRQRMGFEAVGRFFLNFLFSFGGILLIFLGFGVVSIGFLWLVLNIIYFVFYYLVYKVYLKFPILPVVSRRDLLATLKAAWPFTSVAILATIYFRIDMVMIEHILGTRSVGEYAAVL